MSFNSLIQSSARQQMMLLGAVECKFVSQSATSVDTIVVIDRDVDALVDNGIRVEKRTVLNLLREDTGRVRKGDSVLVGDERFTINDIVADDGIVIEVYVRG
jgi:hypothetical protein